MTSGDNPSNRSFEAVFYPTQEQRHPPPAVTTEGETGGLFAQARLRKIDDLVAAVWPSSTSKRPDHRKRTSHAITFLYLERFTIDWRAFTIPPPALSDADERKSPEDIGPSDENIDHIVLTRVHKSERHR